MSVVYIDKWQRQPCVSGVGRAYVKLDAFVRSRIIPPPIGSTTFSFKTGKFTVCGDSSRVRGVTCEILIADGEATVIGNYLEANQMICFIEDEINGIPAEEHAKIA